jgi:cytochrome P450
MRRFSQDPRDPAFVQDPYPAYDTMRALGRAVWWEEYGHWVFPHHAEVSALLRDRRFGREILHVATREELGWDPVPEHLAPFYAFEQHSLLEKEPPAHTRLRKLVNRAFTSRAVDRFRPRIEALAHRLIGGMGAEADLLADYAEPIPVTVIAELLGTPVEAAGQMLGWSHDMVAIYQFRRDRGVEDRAVAATEAFGDFMRRHIAARRKAPADDLISELIAAEEAGDKLSADELVTTCVLLMNAGHEATVHGIGNAVKAVLEEGVDPGVFSGPGAALAVDEMLRFDAPLHMFTRYVLEDLEYAGVRLRKGETIGLMLGAANRDPAVFAGPGRIDPARANAAQHVSFGAGVHFCVGAPLARLEMRVALATLFRAAPSLSLREPPKFADRYHFHGLERLSVTL